MSRIKDLAKKNALRIKRKKRVRANISGTAENQEYRFLNLTNTLVHKLSTMLKVEL